MVHTNFEVGEESGRISRASADFSRLLGRSYIFQATVLLAASAWVISFLSQAIVTADSGNGPVGTLWFAIFIQLGIIGSLLFSIHTSTLFQHGIPLAIFAALTTSFGAQGVNRNIYFGTPAQMALAAGWLITCVIDVIWIILLSSEPSSFIFRVFASGGGVGLSGGLRAGTSNGRTNLNTFQPKYNTDGVLPDNQQRNTIAGSIGGSGVGNEDNRNSRLRSSVAADPETQKRRSAGVWSGYTPPQSAGEGASARNMSSLPPEPSAAPGAEAEVTTGTELDQKPASDMNMEQDTRPVSGSIANTTDAPRPVGKAMALFDYTASPADPYELSFTKGELLDVLDKSGKWWEAIKASGARGIAPSNYLKLL